MVSEFFSDLNQVETSMYYETPKGKKKVWFIKVPNPKTGIPTVFATNLPESMRTPEILGKLYCLRWGAETSFFELSETMKMQQWHSKSFNGILQEFLTTMLIIDLVKILKFFAQEKKPIDPLNETYSKPNFKLLKNYFLLFCLKGGGKLISLINDFKQLIKRSTEKRKRRSRTHPREIRSPASPYPYNNTEWRWEKKYSRN